MDVEVRRTRYTAHVDNAQSGRPTGEVVGGGTKRERERETEVAASAVGWIIHLFVNRREAVGLEKKGE